MPLSSPQKNQATVGLSGGATFFGVFVATVVRDGFTAHAGLFLAGAIIFAGLGARSCVAAPLTSG